MRNDNYPTRKISASFSRAEFIKMGKGYFSNKPGNLTIASHCSPALLDRRPEEKQNHCHSQYFDFLITLI